MDRRPRILFLSARHPYPAWRGDQLRALHLIRCLAQVADVRLVTFGQPPGPIPIPGVDVRAVAPTLLGRVRENAAHPSPVLPLQVRLFLERSMRAAVREEIGEWRPDVQHVTLSRMAPYMAEAQGLHRHLDLVDSMALNMRARSRASGIGPRQVFRAESALAGRYEARMAAAADSVSVVAELDRAERGLERALVIPNGVDPSLFPYREPDESRPPVAIFFGNLGYFHNARPAAFLAGEVIDRLRGEIPDARLVVAGARPPATLRRLAAPGKVEIVADPDEMVPLLHDAAVAAIPMFSGSGMKNKVLEAFCAGTPVVANAAGIEGIEGAVPGEHFLLAEGDRQTAEAIARLMRDPGLRVRLARAAAGLVAERYSWERQADRLMSAYGLAT